MVAKSLLLSRKKSAPASKAATLSAGTAWFVRTTMHAARSPAAARNRRITPKPVPCASWRSTMARSMLNWSQAASASSSVAAVATTATRSGTDTSSTRRSAICGESSTTRACMSSKSAARVRQFHGPRSRLAPRSCRRTDSASLRCVPAWWKALSGDELIFHRIVSDIRIRLEVHLFENAGAISADRLDAEEELFRNLRNALARGELAEDLELALRQLRVRRLVGRGAGEALRELVGDARAHVTAPLRCGDDGGNEVLGRSVLGDEAGGARLQQVDGVLVLRIAAHDEHRHLGTDRLAAIQDIDARHVGERKVHQGNV